MKFGMVFPGYGSQFVGMGKELYDNQRLVQEYFEEAATCLSINFVKLCFASSEVELAKPCHAYTSLFLMSASCAGLLKEKQITPEVVAGVDAISWYSSLFAAGSISLPDGLYILNKLGAVYEEIVPKDTFSGIFVKNSTKQKVAQLCKQASTAEHGVTIVNTLPEGFVVVGHTPAIEKFEDEIRSVADIVYEAADIGGGLYMSGAEEVALQVNSYLEKIDFKSPTIPIISPLDGKLIKKSEDLKHISSIIFVQQLDQLATLKKMNTYDRVVCALPSVRIRPQLASVISDERIVTMETNIEFEALVDLYHPQEERNEEPKDV